MDGRCCSREVLLCEFLLLLTFIPVDFCLFRLSLSSPFSHFSNVKRNMVSGTRDNHVPVTTLRSVYMKFEQLDLVQAVDKALLHNSQNGGPRERIHTEIKIIFFQKQNCRNIHF